MPSGTGGHTACHAATCIVGAEQGRRERHEGENEGPFPYRGPEVTIGSGYMSEWKVAYDMARHEPGSPGPLLFTHSLWEGPVADILGLYG